MEKRGAHCPLAVVHALVERGQVRATGTALSGAAALDLDFDDMLNVIRALTPNDFYKSMTTHNDPPKLFWAFGRTCTSHQPALGMSI